MDLINIFVMWGFGCIEVILQWNNNQLKHFVNIHQYDIDILY